MTLRVTHGSLTFPAASYVLRRTRTAAMPFHAAVGRSQGLALARHHSNMSPRFSAGTDTSTLEAALSPLLVQTGGRWTLAADGEGLERSFRFKTFAKAWVSAARC